MNKLKTAKITKTISFSPEEFELLEIIHRKHSLGWTPYFCRDCYDALLAESGKDENIAGDAWLDDWYKQEKERMKSERSK